MLPIYRGGNLRDLHIWGAKTWVDFSKIRPTHWVEFLARKSGENASGISSIWGLAYGTCCGIPLDHLVCKLTPGSIHYRLSAVNSVQPCSLEGENGSSTKALVIAWHCGGRTPRLCTANRARTPARKERGRQKSPTARGRAREYTRNYSPAPPIPVETFILKGHAARSARGDKRS